MSSSPAQEIISKLQSRSKTRAKVEYQDVEIPKSLARGKLHEKSLKDQGATIKIRVAKNSRLAINQKKSQGARDLERKLARAHPEQAKKLCVAAALSHMEKERAAGHLVTTAEGSQKGPDFQAHEVAGVNAILYGIPCGTEGDGTRSRLTR